MGVMKFRLPANEPANRLADYRKAYITGIDRTPGRISVDVKNGILTCARDSSESGRLFVPWPIEGYGTPIVGTATLAERANPYNLAIELARGKLNDVRNQLSDWTQMGLQTSAELDLTLADARQAFIKAATSTDRPEAALLAAHHCLRSASIAGDLLIKSYTEQVIRTRLATTHRLSTQLGFQLDCDPTQLSPAVDWSATFNEAQLNLSWRLIAPSEGQYRWDLFDAQLAWARRNRLNVEGGPLLDFRKSALPDWIWLWEGDFDTISGLVSDFVRQVVQRYRGKVPIWHVVHRTGSTDILGLSEEEQIRLAARAVQVARQADPSAQFTIGIDRPWGEWMSQSHFQLGPLHLCDYLLRAELGISGVAIEVAPGYGPTGSHIRDPFEFSKLLDLYSLLNVPLYVWMAMPSAATPDPHAEPALRVEASQWPNLPDEQTQALWAARWMALAIAKPYVHTLNWIDPSDALPHRYPSAGLVRPDQSPKQLVSWLRTLRTGTIV
jgi:hypothetical protein